MTGIEAPLDASSAGVRLLLDEFLDADEVTYLLDSSFALEPTAELVPVASKPSDRARRSKIERDSRRRRQAKLRAMRQQVQHLDQQLGRLATALLEPQQPPLPVPPTGMLITNSNDATTALARHDRFLMLKQTTQRLLAEQHDLKRKLLAYQHAHASLQKMLCKSRQEWSNASSSSSTSDAPHDHVPEEEIFRVMHECFETISKFDLTTDYVSSGMAFLGWRDRRRLDEVNDLLNYSFSKFFPGRLAEPMMLATWGYFTDQERLKKAAEREEWQFSFRILQQPNDDVMVIHQCALSPVHSRVMSVFIIFRLRVGNDFVIVTRTISSPSIQQSLQEGDTWVHLFYWTQFKSVADGTEVTWGGSMAPKHCPPMSQFLVDSLSNVVLWESECLPSITLLNSSE